MNVLGLFSGIGGFELGFERAGFNIAAMCECEPYARAVLGKHWPRVPVFPDVRDLTGHSLDVLGFPRIDVITGGFPCQDISLAGKGAGLAGERSGLWREYHRLIDEIRPAWVVIENVSALRSRGLDTVLGSLAAIGYDAEWHCIPASAVGAPHRRDRIWIVAYPNGQSEHAGALDAEMGGTSEPVADADRAERRALAEGRYVGDGNDTGRQEAPSRSATHGSDGGAGDVADADQHPRLARWLGDAIEGARGRHTGGGGVGTDELADAGSAGLEGCAASFRVQQELSGSSGAGWWLSEPDVGRVAHGVPKRVDRLRALGNAVVPQIPEMIARAILAAEAA